MIITLNDNLLKEANDLGTRRYSVDLYESKKAFRNKWSISPDGCFADIEDDMLRGYILSLPWKSNEVVPLSQVVSLPDNPDCWYIHDLCVNSYSQGQGVGCGLIAKSLDTAILKGFKRCFLVAVNNSEVFWIKRGFKILDTIIYTKRVTAVKMVKEL